MIDTQAIRKKILDLALRGKLTEQLPEDGNAETFYMQFLQANHIPELTHRKPESIQMPIISEDKRLFDIPDTWTWAHMGELFSHNTGKALKTSDTSGKLFTYITTSNVYWDRFELQALKQMHFKDDEIEKCTIKKGDLLICEGGDIGRAAIWPFDSEMRIQNHIHRLRRKSDRVCTRFYYYVMLDYKNNNLISGQGIGLEGFSSKRLHNLIVPFPPAEEQVRIANIVDSAFSVLKQIDSLQTQYKDNLTVLKSKIIDACIQGKLTEQLPEDGTAEELYQQIQQEKLELEKAGKIKKSKPLPPVSDEEKPFDIPDNWKWTSVGEVCANIQYGTSKKSSETGKMPVIRMGNLQDGKIIYDKLVYTSDDDEIAKYHLKINDLLFNRTNSMELVGKTAIYKGEIPAIYAGYLVRITPILMVSEYLNYVMQTDFYWDYCRMVRIDANGQSNINAEKLKRFVFPLPPLAEQKRIVSKLNDVLSLCEQ